MDRYESYKDSGIEWIGEIPAEWKCISGGALYFDSKERGLEGDTILSATQDKGVIPKDHLEAVVQNAEDADLSSFKKVRIGDMIISLRSFQGGLSAALEYEGRITPAYTVLRPRLPLKNKFFRYLLSSDGYIKMLNASASGIREGKTIRYKDFRHIVLPLPSVREQNAIAKYLDAKTAEIDSLIEKTEKSIELLEEYRKAVISETVTKGLDPNAPMKDSGIDWIGEIPAHWEKKKLRYAGRTQNGISKSAEYFGHGFPFVTYGNVYRNELSCPDAFGLINTTDAERDAYSIKQGDVLFTRTSETVDEVGIASTCLSDIQDGCFAGFLIRWRPSSLVGLCLRYVSYFFRSDIYRPHLTKEMNLVTRASLSQRLLGSLYTLLPPEEEQLRIANWLDDVTQRIGSMIESKMRLIEEYREYRKSLISEAVTGKFKVPGVE